MAGARNHTTLACRIMSGMPLRTLLASAQSIESRSVPVDCLSLRVFRTAAKTCMDHQAHGPGQAPACHGSNLINGPQA